MIYFSIEKKLFMQKLTYDEISKTRFTKHELKLLPKFPIYVLAENIRSAYNVGSIFRTSDGARIEKLFLSGVSAFPPNKNVEKTALGSTETVNWEYKKNSIDIIRELKSQKISICILEHTNKSIPYCDFPKKEFPVCLVVGNEITGISNEVVNEADLAIEVPMFGLKQSLNASIAYGIALFELVKIFQTRV